MNLSAKIRQCTDGAVNNPYQGNDKRVLFVCSMGILRSATGSRIYGNKYNTRSVGTHDEALIQINQKMIDWADEIVFVNKENFTIAGYHFYLEGANVKVLNIPDEYEHMHPEIIKAFNEQYEEINPEYAVTDGMFIDDCI